MILPALAAGLLCLAVVGRDLLRAERHGFAAARVFITGAWALGWLTYGLNLTRYPQPDSRTLALLGIACLGSVVLVPAVSRPLPLVVAPVFGRSTRVVWWLLAALAVFVIAWDITYIVSRISDYGWSIGLKEHRINRMDGRGAFWLPGFQVMRAAVLGAGAVAFARWTLNHRVFDLVLALFGLAAAILSTGRWEVVNYGVWLFIAAKLVVPERSTIRFCGKILMLLAVLAGFFVGHGQLFGKNEHASDLATLPEDQRIAAAGSVIRHTAPAASSPLPSASAPVQPPARPDQPAAAGVEARAAVEPSAAETPATCKRWTDGLARSNEQFRGLPPVALGVVLYVSGPFAALDRALCEGAGPVRQVLFYWPYKLARWVGLRQAEVVLAVDPYVDIGVPFNNYSVMYPFLNEIGPIMGPIMWLMVAAVIRRLAGWLSGSSSADLRVAAAAPVSMAVRTPWTNTYFDGTLVVWVVVALAGWMASQRDARVAGPPL